MYRWLRAMDRVTAVGIVQYLSLLIASQAGGSSEWYVPLTKFSSALSQGRKMERLGRWWSCLRDVLKTGLALTSGREDGPQTWRRLLESSAAAAYYVFQCCLFRGRGPSIPVSSSRQAGQAFEGSISVVSKPIFASQYSFYSIF